MLTTEQRSANEDRDAGNGSRWAFDLDQARRARARGQDGLEDAKEQVSALLESFGWNRERILDLGDISGARGTDMYVMLWLRLYQAVGTSHFNVHVVR